MENHLELCDHSLTYFLASLQVESTAEGEAQRYFDHALTLKNTILFLRYNKELTQDQGPDIPNIGTSKRVCTPVVWGSKQHCRKVMGYFIQIVAYPAFPVASECLQPVLKRPCDISLLSTPGFPLDMLRCESLLGLDQATCSRVLNKNYKLLVSMAPLSNEIRPISSCTPQVGFLGGGGSGGMSALSLRTS